MKIDTNDMITVSDAQRVGVSKLVNDASKGHQRVVLRNSQPLAAIVNIETMERLQRIEELEEDVKLVAIAWARTLTDSGERYSLDEVAAEFGVDLSDEED